MRLISRLLMSLPRNLFVPAVVLFIGWYGGARYGMPDYVMNSINSSIAQAVDLAGGLFGGEDSGDTTGAEG